MGLQVVYVDKIKEIVEDVRIGNQIIAFFYSVVHTCLVLFNFIFWMDWIWTKIGNWKWNYCNKSNDLGLTQTNTHHNKLLYVWMILFIESLNKLSVSLKICKRVLWGCLCILCYPYLFPIYTWYRKRTKFNLTVWITILSI